MTGPGKATAVLYLRKSPSNSGGDHTLSLDAQATACHAEALRLGLEVEGIYADHLSGKLPLAERAELLSAVSALRKGGALIVARRDRLGRDLVNVTLIERAVTAKGARVVSCAGEASGLEGPSGDLIRSVLDIVAQYERATIALRTKAALRQKRARGELAGACPFGFTVHADGRTLVPDPDGAKVLATIQRLRDSGCSWGSIAVYLNREGIPASKGGRWFPASVRGCMNTAARALAGK